MEPFKNDLPSFATDGYSRVCTEHKYAFVVPNFLNTRFLSPLPCKLVPLPETSYRDPWAFITSKNSSYKGLINWRWDNKMNTIRYMTDNLRLLWVPCKLPKAGGQLCLLLDTKALTRGRYDSFEPFLIRSVYCYISL
jgi:hypothetical protein